MTYVPKLCFVHIRIWTRGVCVQIDYPDTGQHFSKNSDRIRTADRIETDRILTDRHRAENLDRIGTADRIETDRIRTDTGQKIRTESGQQTDIGHDIPKNPDKNETRTVLSADVCLVERL